MNYLIALLTVVSVSTFPAGAQTLPPADIYVLGEIHDNPHHHVVQARLVETLDPAAVVFEQLTDEQADRLSPDTPRDAHVLGEIFDWANSGWPDIAMYAPIMAATDAPILGAAGAPDDLSAYGLSDPLPQAEQTAREQLQADAHCGALPAAMLPQFVQRQRQADALFASRTIAAFDRYGGPVVLIAGNGHARTDWGVPAAIARVRPDLRVVALIQGEGGETLPGDVTVQSDAPDRDDPCAAFR
ncbi:ChaN family lipoprotein [Jannaschia donghaensis]|uniref:Putative iron-regulated protein n=1 Tax=Jannaschia donghaensis TaxID=420998 RepID=A0A0M6YCQ5_9RHOB|nr:ChaN family lipoprotein [Jannaschia donghaensis]CTQ48128.1 putative iron-regulated protein [Jannaschia donghaensis]